MTQLPARPRSGLPFRVARRFRDEVFGRPPSPLYGLDMLHRARFVRSDDPGYRLNLVVPTLESARVFGGIRTAMDLFEVVAASAPEHRVVAGGGDNPVSANAQAEGVANAGRGAAPKGATDLGRRDAVLDVRPNDVFIATFWTTAELVMRIRRWQAETFGRVPSRFGYVVQDFEPGFYPYSVNSELSRATYADPESTVAVFNTSILRDWFHGQGIRFGIEHTFEPRGLPQLLSAASRPPVPRTRTILIYGRPKTPRNAFASIVEGLRLWRATDPERAATWTVTSIGESHHDIDLGGGMVLKSAGKLSLDEYARRLREAAVGVSLMVSAHPSYPPLEMAHLGMLVVTNRFGAKDLSTWHPNITSTADLRGETVAAAITAATDLFQADPGLGDRRADVQTPFTSSEPQFPFAADFAAELEAGTHD